MQYQKAVSICSVVGVCILPKDCKAESRASRRTGASYNRTDSIKDLYRVMSISVLTPIFRFVMASMMLNLEFILRLIPNYMSGECESSVYCDPEIFIFVDNF